MKLPAAFEKLAKDGYDFAINYNAAGDYHWAVSVKGPNAQAPTVGNGHSFEEAVVSVMQGLAGYEWPSYGNKARAARR